MVVRNSAIGTLNVLLNFMMPGGGLFSFFVDSGFPDSQPGEFSRDSSDGLAIIWLQWGVESVRVR
ncbi:MAG TPA: hypothetical protein PKG49_00060 [Nitrosomonas mobilis]|uniref:Uncharacterized protein n=2 Tax=Nitrosomonas mobilis TaxID=51642 RepID=A0A1G5SH25_9PROT|nr:hypothetical protein NSMM_510025 [Nitrosomonas mobilis]HNO74022.1 hypothetical protein [Nitrosomonas mobilis]